MNAKLKAAVIAGKFGNGEDEKKKREEAQKKAISEAQSSGKSSNVSQADTSANASIYYRGYDKSGREVRIKQEDMPQNPDERIKLAWKHNVRSFTKVTEADAASKQQPAPKKEESSLSERIVKSAEEESKSIPKRKDYSRDSVATQGGDDDDSKGGVFYNYRKTLTRR